jgi:hypothetical protein
VCEEPDICPRHQPPSSIKSWQLTFGVAIVHESDLQIAGTEGGDVHRCMTPFSVAVKRVLAINPGAYGRSVVTHSDGINFQIKASLVVVVKATGQAPKLNLDSRAAPD